jgi:glycosyltransferase involved in cell wall biosynthesis
MGATERTVLHVLPHAGGGGDTYVDVLEGMPGYTFDRGYLAPARKPGPGTVARGVADVARRASSTDLLHVHGEATGALFLPFLVARPSVVTLHGLHLLRRFDGARRRAAEVNLRALLRAADRTICVSNAERDVLVGVIGDTAAHRARVIHNGAEPVEAREARALRGELGLHDSDVVGIWVGSLDERRDPVAVVRAAERTSTPLLIAGEGQLRAQVERAAEGYVRVLGQRADVRELLDAADFFVLMSEREGFSFALLEAMAHGLPAIVADIPENIEAIGDSGIAVPYGDEEATATAMRRLTEDGAYRNTLAERARRRIAEHFSAEQMVEQTRTLYDDVLSPA